jgi:transposase
MIDPDMRNAIFKLHTEGMSARQISRCMHVSRNTVRTIIAQQGKFSPKQRKDKLQLDAQLLRRLVLECDGWVQRVHEKLVEEEHIQVGYSTLTRRLRELGLSLPHSARCDRVPDEPGVEMQHDTTVYQIPLAQQKTKLIASLLYLRYSKRRYLKFYRVFNRFAMKCFLHEGLMFWGYSAPQCIIDNTNLARLRGAGKGAIIVAEMNSFSRRYGFEFVCHAINHPNRKAGEERSFWTVETNFLPGRTFESLEDLNGQARQWATERMEQRPQSKSRLIPAKAFEHEQNYLHPLPRYLPPPYQEHQRGTDQYGYVAFGANYYWVPGSRREDVKVLQYADSLKIFLRHECLAEYPLPADGVREQRFSPPDQPPPRYQPNNIRRRDARQEEQALRALGREVADYLDFALKAPGIQPHRFTRGLFAFSRKLPHDVLAKTLTRALRYRIVDLATVQRIAWLCLSQADDVLPEADLDEDFQQRPAYQAGSLTDPPDLSVYDQLFDPQENDEESENDNQEDDQQDRQEGD